jgi:hypothetical protein
MRASIYDTNYAQQAVDAEPEPGSPNQWSGKAATATL